MNGHYPAGCSQSDVDRSCNGDTDEIDELDELTVLDCGHSGTIRNAEQTGGRLVCEECFLHPPQLPRFSNRRTAGEVRPIPHASDCAVWVDEPCDCVTGKNPDEFKTPEEKQEFIGSLMGGLRSLAQ